MAVTVVRKNTKTNEWSRRVDRLVAVRTFFLQPPSLACDRIVN